MKKPRSRVAIISVLLLGILIFAMVYGVWNTVFSVFQPANSSATGKVSIVIQPQETTAQIADDLQSKGVIRNALAFRIWARVKGLDTRLQAGVYTNLSPGMSINEITDDLLKAQPDAVQLTVVEGWRIEQIAQKLKTLGLSKFNEQDFLRYAHDPTQFPHANQYSILQSVPRGRSMEGLLFPATYDIPANATAVDVLDQMLKATMDVINANNLAQIAPQHNLTLYQSFILASLVEREVVFDADRGDVASVYWNRLMNPAAETADLLGSDPSVEYARDTDNPPTVYWKDLNNQGGNISPNSPWNTYTHKGLPPTPICSPSLKSLLVAVNPPKTDYFYFLGKKDGHVVFAKTYAEFQTDVTKYLGQ
jgi:UPF0755 protein